jgi:2-keto-4-pentenoate hydratase/2-oxohepta-3-ene-1,7-dioic acid hydratase in catechol pathway
MTHWIRFLHEQTERFGVLEGEKISVFEGDMFAECRSTGQTLGLDEVSILPPSKPSKMIGLWNNFHAAAEKNGWAIPEQPLYFIKPPSCFLGSGGTIRRPSSYDGRVVYEGELGIVIGRNCTAVTEEQADDYIFGYTCINDVTALQLINEDPAFPQWTRAKSFDTFGPFGPTVATGVDPGGLTVKTLLNGRERQSYPVSDMIFPPKMLVSRISHDMSLCPGDIIACGTSLGVLPMKPGSAVEVVIDGIGTLRNTFE